MSDKNVVNEQIPYQQAVIELISDLKKKNAETITYDELTKQIANPYTLNKEQMEDLLQQMEENGLGVVDEAGDPMMSQVEKGEKDVKEAKRDDTLAPPGVKINDPVRMYLKEIGRVDLLSADEEVSLAKRIEAGDDEAKQELAEANLRLSLIHI